MNIFLADEHFPTSSTYLLRNAGYEVTAIVEDSVGVADTEVMARAVLENRIILTFDRDYGELIYRRGLPAPAGVVHFRFLPLSPEEAGHRILALFGTATVPLAGYYTVIDQNQIRQRRLP